MVMPKDRTKSGIKIPRQKALTFAATSIFFLVLILSLPPAASARVTGPCANCHTMHNSQGGLPIAPGGPYGQLLVGDCVGCHSATDGATWKDPVTGAPIVNNTGQPSYGSQGLAGGNFYWVTVSDANGHNIFSTNPDDVLMSAPGEAYVGGGCGTNVCHSNLHLPFQASSEFEPIHGYLNGRSGCTGCHMVSGFNKFSQIKSWHHTSVTDGVADSAAEGWYRFLSGHFSGYQYGVAGIEDGDWQYTSSASDHNEYLGKQVASGTGGFVSIAGNTTTAFCCGCHGNFHIKRQGGAWIRHPVDRRIPASGEYADAFGAGGGTATYDPIVPVARPALVAVSDTVTIGTDMVMCLSCHRAHASPYPDMLRWDYATIQASGGGNSGCFQCHTRKN